MKKLLTYLIIFWTTTVFSQHITVDNIDKFTDNREIQINGSKGKKWSASDGITKNVFKGSVFLSTKVTKTPKGEISSYLNLNIQSGTVLCFGGDEIIMLFENNKKVTLKQISQLECNTVNNVRYHITEADIKTLSNTKIEGLRVYTRDGYIDYEIKDKAKEIIQKTFQLTKDKLGEIIN